MKKILFCLAILFSLSACADESEDITPKSDVLNNSEVSTDGTEPPTNHGSN